MSPALEQGDILRQISVLVPEHAPVPGSTELSASIVSLDAIILTQTCDIEQRKVDDLIVGAIIDWAEMVRVEGPRNQLIRSSKFRDKLIEGSIPSMSLLHKHEEPFLNWSVVNFKQLFSVPRSSIESMPAFESTPRLRLISPYKEHLAQSFARFFMRVGLPLPADDFREYAPG